MAEPEYDHEFPSCARTYASLYIYHETMLPAAITAQLGLESDDEGRRGDRGALGRALPRNFWRRSTYDVLDSRDVRYHVDTILDELEGKEAELRKLRDAGCELVMACFWESASGNGGPLLDPAFLTRLARYPIALSFDVWFALAGEPAR